MRLSIVILFIITLVGAVVPCLPLGAQSVNSPHENPATAEYTADPVWLLLFHGDVLSMVAGGNYEEARMLLDEFEYASIPEELRYVTSRYRDISYRLLTALDNLDTLLIEATDFLAQYQLTEAGQKLQVAGDVLVETQSLLQDIQQASTILSQKFSMFGISPDDEIGQARGRLLEIMVRLENLVNRLEEVRTTLVTKCETQEHEKLITTQLTLGTGQGEPFIGDMFTVYGQLMAGGRPLANRDLELYLDEATFAATTDANGVYTTEIILPYRYVDEMTLSAGYVPSGDDLGTYYSAKSLPLVINTRFYETSITINTPEAAYPGMSFTVRGNVGSTGDPAERELKLFLDDSLLTTEKVTDSFEISVDLPEEVAPGEHNLSVTVSSLGCYSEASAGSSISVSRLPVEADIRISPFIVLPGRISISGRIFHDDEPVPDASVVLKHGDSTATVRTSDDGSFKTTVPVPLDLSLAGLRELEVSVEPAQPYYESLKWSNWVFAVNPVSIALLVIGLVSAGAVTYGRLVRRPAFPDREIPSPETVKGMESVILPLPVSGVGLTGNRKNVAVAYVKALEIIERRAGINLGRNQTMREFLKLVSDLSTPGMKSFTELTALTEVAVYASREPGEEMIAEANRLAVSVMKEIRE